MSLKGEDSRGKACLAWVSPHTWKIGLEVGGGREDCNEEKCKGRSRKPLAEVFSLERPVARHFVCYLLKHPLCHSQTAENTGSIFDTSGRNCPLGGKFYRLELRWQTTCRTLVEISQNPLR
jgi:hypothetical protein